MIAPVTPQKDDTIRCPICKAAQISKYEITELSEEVVEWFHCYCGTVFHTKGIDKTVFNEAYLEDWTDKKGVDLRMDYVLRTYLPLIEEMTYGRKFLDVGFTLPHNILTMKERGWIATGVDIMPNDFITEDFEKFEFEDTFDFIYMGNVLQSFKDPVRALVRAYKLLSKDGLLMITTPAPELIHSVGLEGFGAWDSKHAHIFLSEKELKRITLGCGFDWVLNRVNFSQRFITWNDRHLILQKRY